MPLGRLRPYTGALLLAAFLATSLVTLATWLDAARRQRTTVALLRDSVALRDAAGDLLTALLDAETGQRGHLITGRGPYLEPYLAGRQRTVVAQGRLRLAAGRGGDLAARLDAIDAEVQVKLDELQETVRRVVDGDKAGAYLLVNTDQGKASMDRLRAALGGLLAEADAAEAAAEAEQARALAFSTASVVVGKLIGAALFCLMFAVSLVPYNPRAYRPATPR